MAKLKICLTHDLRTHKFNKGFCVNCTKSVLYLAASTTATNCDHVFHSGRDGCIVCGVSVASSMAPAEERDAVRAYEVMSFWNDRGKGTLLDDILKSIFRKMKLEKSSDLMRLKIKEDMEMMLEHIGVEEDPYRMMEMYVRGLLLYAFRYARNVKEKLERTVDPKSGPVETRRFVKVRGRGR